MASTLDQIVRWTGEAFEPAASAVAAGERDVLGLLRRLGYALQTAPPSILALEQPADLLFGGLRELFDALEVELAGGDAAVDLSIAGTEVTVAIVELVDRIDKLSTTLPQEAGNVFGTSAAATELTRRLLDLLLVAALARHDRLGSILRAVGVMDEEEVDILPAGQGKTTVARLRPERIPKAIAKPSELAQELYGWGKPTFHPDAAFERAADVALAFGRQFFVSGPEPALVQLVGGDLDAPGSALSIPILTDPVVLEAVVLGAPPQQTGDLPGLGLTLALGAAGTTDVPVGERTKLVFEGSGTLSGGLLLVVRPGKAPTARFDLAGTGISAEAGVRLEISPRPSEIRLVMLNIADVVVIDAAGAALGGSFSVDGAKQDVGLEARVDEGKLAVGTGKADGFLAKVLPEGGLIVPFGLHLTWSHERGLQFEGGAGLTLRSTKHHVLGPISIDTIEVTVTLETGGIKTRGTLDASLALGPIGASVEKIGARADIAFHSGSLGPLDLKLGFKPPSGAGLVIKAGPVTGGGYIFFDPDNEEYAGVLQIGFNAISVTAIALLTTRLPDASGAPGATKKGFSLLVIIAVELPPIQLGYGFTLNGVGGLLGVHRTMVVDTLRNGVRDGTVAAILFPPDPVKRATQIISNLRSVFPPAEGRFVFGPMVKLGWGPNAIIELSVALVLELMSPIRLVILGRVQVALPDKKDPVLNLRLDVVGVLDFDRSEASVDASLVDSKLTKFALTGDMAMRLGWGATKTFAIAAGGFNRKFQPPPGFPTLGRLALSISDSDNPRLRLGAYKALTANTIQFGAEVDAYVKLDTAVGVFSASGLATFDALIQFQPFRFEAGLSATIDIARNNVPLLHAALSASFTGPNPWHAIGYAEFDFLGKWRIDFEATAGAPLELPEVKITAGDLALELTKALARPDSWAALPPPDGGRIVSLGEAPIQGAIAVHPLGSLTIRQRVVPLEKTMTRFGTAIVDGVSMKLVGVGLGASAARNAPLDHVRDDFAPGQFEALTDDQKLARPAFESMRSGAHVGTGATGLPADAAGGTPAQIGYEEAIVDVEPTSGARSVRQVPTRRRHGLAPRPAFPKDVLAGMTSGGAAAHAATRASSAQEFAGPSLAVKVSGERYVAADADTLGPVAGSPTGGASYAEANEKSPAGTDTEVALAHEAA